MDPTSMEINSNNAQGDTVTVALLPISAEVGGSREFHPHREEEGLRLLLYAEGAAQEEGLGRGTLSTESQSTLIHRASLFQGKGTEKQYLISKKKSA